MKSWFYGIIGVVAICVLFLAWFGYRTGQEVDELVRSDAIESVGYSPSHLDVSYRIEDAEVQFTGGEGVLQAGGTVRVSGEPIEADLNADGSKDRILLLETSSAPESYARWYLVAALAYERGYFGSNAIPLGNETYRPSALYDIVTVSSDHATASSSAATATTTGVVASAARYFYVFGATLAEYGPFEGEGVARYGRYLRTGDARSFTDCTDEEYVVAEDSSALAALDAIYRERSGSGEGGAVFMLLVGSVDEAAEDAQATMLVQSVLSSPSDGACDNALNSGSDSNVFERMPATTTDPVATTTESRE